MVNASSSKPPIAKAPREQLASGAVIAERYRIIEVIGEGGMGTVYAAEHLLLRKKVAIKVLHLDLLKLPNITARFEREAHAMARLEHPNATAALDFGTLPNQALYLVLEFVDGRRLRDEMSKGPLPLTRALSIAKQIASLLVLAQSQGIVHRDLKPENVILTQRGDESDFVKVLDFGIARMTSVEDEGATPEVLTKLGAVFGTPEYMAPEQALGQRVDTRADLYSLGVMLFEMLSGVRPYVYSGQTGILSQQITQPRPTFAERAPHITVPEEVERFVYRLLSKGAQERYQRASDVLAVIEGLLIGREAPKAVSVPPPSASSEPLPSFDLNTHVPGLPTSDIESKPKARGTLTQQILLEQLKRLSVQAQSGTKAATLTTVNVTDKVYDQILASLSPKLRERVATVPKSAARGLLIATAVLLVVLPILVVVKLVTRSGSAELPVAAASALPSASAAPVASSAEIAEPEVPLDETSKDPEILLKLALERLKADRESEALSLVVRVLGTQSERRNDERVAQVLYRTANSLNRDVSDKTFSLLLGTMAAKGAEIQYQLWLDKSIRESTRRRVDRWLRSEELERAASGAIIVATRLRLADSCEKKLQLIPTAGKIGGSAALSYLVELESEKGCGFDGNADCFPCLRADKRLKDAIAQIRSRQTPK